MGRASTWKNLAPAVPRVLLSEIFGEPCLTWSDRRKNKPIKQEPKIVVVVVVVVVVYYRFSD